MVGGRGGRGGAPEGHFEIGTGGGWAGAGEGVEGVGGHGWIGSV